MSKQNTKTNLLTTEQFIDYFAKKGVDKDMLKSISKHSTNKINKDTEIFRNVLKGLEVDVI